MNKLLLFLLISLLILSGCTQGTPTAATTDVATPAPTNRVIAEAAVEPVQWSELSFEESGTVAELLVAEGETVEEGDLLVRLDPADADLAVQKAEAELSAAQARLSQAEAGTRAEQLAVDEAELKARQAELSQATARRDELQVGQLQADIVQAEAEFTEADVAAWSAEDIYEAFGYILQDEAKNKLIAARAARTAAEAQLAT
ncbi:MAG: biotin/lipoyl-binding protein, partial [Desulfofustis sp.]|nr:biotin/lipoyl-binding protein [Desulfofustis sp.]